MAFSEMLAARVRDVVGGKPAVTEKKMFGGVAFLLNGNMLVGVWKDSLIVRLGPEQSDEALREPHVQVFDITGRPMKGWILIGPEGIERDQELASWIERATEFVQTLPAK